MTKKLNSYITSIIILISLSIIFIFGENLKSYLLSFSISILAILFFLYSENGKNFKNLIRSSFYDIKTYTLPDNKYIFKLTLIILTITLITSIFIFFINNILKLIMY